MDAKVTWQGGLTFNGSSDSGFRVPLGADPAVGGANDGFRPLELMALSLAGCTAMDVISILRKKQQVVTSYEVRVQADLAREHPRVFTRVVLTYELTGHALDEQAVIRALDLSATKYCPAQAMLGKTIPIEITYEIYEGADKNDRTLLTKGLVQPGTQP